MMQKLKISPEEIIKNQPLEFINLVVSKYKTVYENEIKNENLVVFNELFSENQIAIIRFIKLYHQIFNGGYLQFFINKKETLLVTNNFIEVLKKIGGIHIAEITIKAYYYFHQNRERIEEIQSIEDYIFVEKSLKKFKEYDLEFYNIMQVEILAISNYIRNNLKDFIYIPTSLSTCY